MQDPNEDTEWNDILRKFGILQPKTKPKEEEESSPTVRVLNACEDEERNQESLDEECALLEYREKRLQQWKATQVRPRFGELREVKVQDYENEITLAEEHVWVVVHLFLLDIPLSAQIDKHLSNLARKFPRTKFVRASARTCLSSQGGATVLSSHCVSADPSLPALCIYISGNVKGTINAQELSTLSLLELELKLAVIGAVQSDLQQTKRAGGMKIIHKSDAKNSTDRDSEDSV
uniref:phosducin-like protein 2 isoform X3 n=1 Tax=Myxine glutinosa TaxID=7769 RepID=UPI003590194B